MKERKQTKAINEFDKWLGTFVNYNTNISMQLKYPVSKARRLRTKENDKVKLPKIPEHRKHCLETKKPDIQNKFASLHISHDKVVNPIQTITSSLPEVLKKTSDKGFNLNTTRTTKSKQIGAKVVLKRSFCQGGLCSKIKQTDTDTLKENQPFYVSYRVSALFSQNINKLNIFDS